MTWCFRIRADIRENSKLECADPEWVIEDRGPGRQVKLISRTPGPLSEARSVALLGSGYGLEDEAIEDGQLWRARLMRAFAAARIGADFGDRAPEGGFTTAAPTVYGPPDRRVLTDVRGLTVFECEPAPSFFGIDLGAGIVTSPHERLVQAMTEAIEAGGLSEERQVAYDLFATSFGQPSADARFALLMMALESLIDPAPRPEESRRHVQGMIEATKRSGLAKSEIDSINGTLRWQLKESIRQAGKRLAGTLEDRRYKDEPPAKFFIRCYDMRSRLLHGLHPLPTRNEIDAWAAQLEVFVADLLSGQEVARGTPDSGDDSTEPKLISRIIRYLSNRADKLRRH